MGEDFLKFRDENYTKYLQVSNYLEKVRKLRC